MIQPVPDHERLFNEICNKLNELSRARAEEEPVNHQEKIDRLQTQIRRFQTDLHDTQSELREKIRGLENVQVSEKTDMHQQLKGLTDQLAQERAVNTKLNQDLARSLELGLQLQLEIQGLKARSQQVQAEERKFAQSLQDKIRTLSHDLELARALREEIDNELTKSNNRYHEDQEAWEKSRQDLLSANEELMTALKSKETETQAANADLEQMASTFNELENSSRQQHEALKNLAMVAENKIVELKMALDRKTAESRDFEGHLQHSLTQNQLLKQENASLKDYIAKINIYLQNSSPAPAAPTTPMAPPPEEAEALAPI